MFRARIVTGGAAFHSEEKEMDNYERNAEVARILRDVADRIESGEEYGTCMDINGNAVGDWKI